MIWLIACMNYTDRMTIFTVFPALKKEKGLSDIGLALIGSTFLWAYAIYSPNGGYLGDRFPRRQVILWSLLILVPQQNLWVHSGSGNAPRLW